MLPDVPLDVLLDVLLGVLPDVLLGVIPDVLLDVSSLRRLWRPGGILGAGLPPQFNSIHDY